MEYGLFSPHLPHIPGDEGGKFASDYEGTGGTVESALYEGDYSVGIHDELGAICAGRRGHGNRYWGRRNTCSDAIVIPNESLLTLS